MKYKFSFAEKRTRRATHDMMLMMAKYGNHGYPQRFISDADVKRFFKSKGHYWEDIVETCRKPNAVIPFLENLIGSTWRVSGSAKAAIVTGAATDKEKEITSVEGPGTLTASTYLQLFENAVASFNRCMESSSFGDFQSCVSNGIASIDAYIAHRAWLYNSDHPSEELVDTKQNKVSQDTKIDEWIPRMSNGKRLDKSRANWENFRKLRTVRDDLAIHLKQPAFGISDQQLGGLLNLFRSGIAGMLIDLHLLFTERIACGIIRYAYLPDIMLVETED